MDEKHRHSPSAHVEYRIPTERLASAKHLRRDQRAHSESSDHAICAKTGILVLCVGKPRIIFTARFGGEDMELGIGHDADALHVLVG
jgi:hypothetical protein